MKRLWKCLEAIIKTLCVVLFLALTCVLVLMISSRNFSFITLDVLWTDEISRYLFVYIVFLGSGLAMMKGKHIRVEFVLDKLPPKVRKYVELFNEVLTAAFCVVMISGGYTLVKNSSKQAVSTLRKYFVMPMSWWNYAILVSGIVMLLAVIVKIYKMVKDKDLVQETEEGGK